MVAPRRSLSSALRVLLSCSLLSTAMVVLSPIPAAAEPATGAVSGTVFRDFGVDGQFDDVDGLEAGIEVRVFDDDNNVVGPVVSGADGSYTLYLDGLTKTRNDTYRVEFTIPAGSSHLQPGFLGDDNAGPVQFVSAGSSDADFAVTNPAQYCDSDPSLAVTCFVSGQADGLNAGDDFDSDGYDALVTLPWSGHSSDADLNLPSNPSFVADNGQIGTTWGLAYQRATDQLFVGAAQRRHTGFGPGGTGMIYRIGADGTGQQEFFDVNDIVGTSTGVDPHSGLPTRTWYPNDPASAASYDAASFDAVGKIGLGDIDISEDEETLWAVNLNDRTLLEIPIGVTGVAPNPADVTVHQVGSAVTCTDGVFRPFALAVRDGDVYIGGVCTGESNGGIGDVSAHLLRHDPDGADGNTTSVHALPMNYRQMVRQANAECAFFLADQFGNTIGEVGCEGWEPWRASWSDLDPEGIILAPGTHQFYAAPQPMLTDIEIDIDGSVVLAFADRFGLQSGFRNYDDSGTNTTLHSGTTAGDLIRLCNVDGTLTFPCNADGVEHYTGDGAPGTSNPAIHPESGWGAIAMHFRSGEVAMTIADPIRVWSGGIGWYDKVTGLISDNSPSGTTRRYEVFRGGENDFTSSNPDQTGIGKATGLGDLELLCQAAPIQIGDRVWFDRNGNGRQDPSEPALPNVTVRLLDNNGDEIASTTTGPDGVYSFDSVNVVELGPLSDYTILFDESTADISNVAGLADVSLLEPTTTDAAAADDNDDSDIGADRRISVSTEGAGASRFTYDAGFRGGLQIGDLVWLDVNNNGDADDGEPVLADVTLQLFRETGTSVGFDGGDELVSTTATTAEGIYSFQDLIDGETYYVAVPDGQPDVNIVGQALDVVTLASSTGTATNPVDNNDDGNPVSGFLAVTGGLTVSDDPASEPTGEADTPPDPDTDSEQIVFDETDHLIDDDDSNLTFDFGFSQSLRIGNLVWLDGALGEVGFNNGQADAAESGLGIGGVTVALYADDGDNTLDPANDTLVDTVVTDADGNYWFDDVEPGNYIAAIPSDQTTQTVDGETVDLDDLFVSGSSVATGDTDDVNDGTDLAGFASVSALFAVANDAEPADEAGDFNDPTEDGAETAANATRFFLDANSDLTVDFSFVEKPTFELGNLVWLDANDNGIAEDGEPGIGGVTVELFRVGENTPLDSVQTETDGTYLFASLEEGSYYVQVAKVQTGQVIGTRDVDLSTLLASSVNEPNADAGGVDDVDNDNNGVMVDETLQSGPVSLGLPDPFAPTESTTETVRSNDLTVEDTSAQDPASNLTVDFAFVEPLRLGNIVWLDNGGGEPGDPAYVAADENDGQADTTEAGIEGVLVQLIDADGDVVAETLTTAEGRYVFDGLRSGAFTVAIPADQSPVLDFGLAPDPTALTDLRSSDGQSATPETSDDDDDGEPADGYASISDNIDVDYGAEADDELGDFNDVTAGAAEAGVNVNYDPIQDVNSNLQVDFGFAPVPTFTVGNLLWEDYDNDGLAETGEPGIGGALVQLVNADGDVVAETVTDGAGHYLFENLEVGDYQIRVPTNQEPELDPQPSIIDGALDGLTVSQSVTADPDEPASTDNDTNGSEEPGGDVVTGVFSVGEGDTHSEPTGETLRNNDPASDEPTDERPDRNDLTIDIGFWRGLRLGNLVWMDGLQGETGYDNGVVDPGETGLVGVGVELWIDVDGDGTPEPGGDDGTSAVRTTMTDGEGNYLFAGLDEDVPYFVAIPSVPSGYSSRGQSSVPIDAGSGGADNDDDGVPDGDYAAVSEPVILAVGAASTGETDTDNGDNAELEANQTDAVTPDGNSELRLDFGFIDVPVYRLGNLVFHDNNANALADTDESGIPGVLVQLTDADGMVFAETVTNTDGNYLFDNLVAGELMVRIPADQQPELGEQSTLDPDALVGAVSPTTGEEQDADNDTDNDDNGIAQAADGTGSDPLVDLAPEAWKTSMIRLGPPPGDSGDIAPPFGTEPVSEVDPFDGSDDDPDLGEAGSFPDGLSNLSVDFGFIGMAIGNHVWFDTNADGVRDDAEPGINDVVVNIYVLDEATDELLLVNSTVTANDGEEDGRYLLGGLLPNRQYVVEIPVTQFEPGSALHGMFSSPDAAAGAVNPNEGGVDDDGVDGDDNGPDADPRPSADAPVPAEPIRSLPVELTANGEPVDADANIGPASDDNENLTVDFGFVGLAVGNVVWLDSDGDGSRGEAEPGLSDVAVELWPAVDGLLAGTEPLAFTTTDAEGEYLFAALQPGDYVVVLPSVNFDDGGALSGLTSTTGNGAEAPTVDGLTQDDDDNGNVHPAGMILADPFTLDWAAEPTVETSDLTGFDPANTDLTVDFGMVPIPPMSLGNRVFADLDNSGDQSDDEPGIAGVTVELWSDDPQPTDPDSQLSVLATAVTDADGYYLFADLAPGDYVVVIPAANFAAGATLSQYHPSTASGYPTDPDDDVDQDTQGAVPVDLADAVRAQPVTLIPSLEPSGTDQGSDGHGQVDGEAIAGHNSNLTIDFGFISLGVGNRVFFDADNSGVQDAGEAGIGDVELVLLNAAGQVIATTVTDSDGYYLFTGLAPGDYSASVADENFADGAPLAGMFTSTGNGEPAPGVETTPVDEDDNGTSNDAVSADQPGVESSVFALQPSLEPVDEPGPDQGAAADDNADLTVDFGFYTSTLVTTVGIDANGNGELDPHEPVSEGTLVEVLDESGAVIGQDLSDVDGAIVVEGLPETTIQVHLPPENFAAGGPLENVVLDDDLLTPDGGVLGEPFDVLAGDNSVELAQALGQSMIPEAVIGDTVWRDDDADGIRDSGEPGLPGVTVILRNDAGDEVARTESTSDGSYEFDDLLPEVYTVEVVLPDDFKISPMNAGSDDSMDSDIDPSTRRSTPIDLSAGEQEGTVDIGLAPVDVSSGGGAADSPATGTTSNAPSNLARTGSATFTMVAVGAMALTVGAALVVTGRRRIRKA